MDGLTAHEAEKAVIGALLTDPHRARELATITSPGDFESAPLGALYALITRKQLAGEAVDALTIWSDIRADETLSRTVRSATMLHDLIEATPVTSNAVHYARQVAEAGQSRRLQGAGARLMQLAEGATMSAAEKLTAARAEIDRIASEAAQELTAPTLTDVLAVPDADVEWVVPGFLARRDRLVLTGAEGGGKTTLLRQIIITTAAGLHPWTFERITPARVLVVDTENSEDQWRWETRAMVTQAARHGTQNPADNIRVYCTGRLNIASERDLAAVHGLLDTYQPDILVIGPLYKLSPKGMNVDEDAAPVIAALDGIRDRPDGPILLMEAHAGHAIAADGERNLRPRGSSMQLGWPEFGLGIMPDRNDETGTVSVVRRWRGNRIRGRYVPQALRSGGDWPWMEDGAAGNGWLERKHETQQRHIAA